MEQECFQMEENEIFGCETSDLNSFYCTCVGTDSTEQKIKSISFIRNASSFPFWLNKHGLAQENTDMQDVNGGGEEGGKDVKSINLKQLFDHCKQKNELPLKCRTKKRVNRFLAYCYCELNPRVNELQGYYFKSLNVWSGPNLATNSPYFFDMTTEYSLNSASSISNHFPYIVYVFLLILFLALISIVVKYRRPFKNFFSKRLQH